MAQAFIDTHTAYLYYKWFCLPTNVTRLGYFERFWRQIFLLKLPKKLSTFGLIWKTAFLKYKLLMLFIGQLGGEIRTSFILTSGHTASFLNQLF